MIRFRLDKLLKDRELTAYRLSMESGIHQRVLSKYVNNQVREISLETLNTICKTLRCQVGDLIKYVPDKTGQ
jgi:putative transcriptional regulator